MCSSYVRREGGYEGCVVGLWVTPIPWLGASSCHSGGSDFGGSVVVSLSAAVVSVS